MQLYVLDRAKNTLATSAEFYNDVHKKALSTGSSTFEFTIDKSEDAAQYLTSGNYVVFQDDHGRAWSFTILDYEEHQTSKTVYLEDVGIELINKNMDIWNTTEAHSFAYYFDLITQDTPWQLGINQVADLSRKLVYTGRDTGLGRLLSILKGFDNAECQFNVVIKGNQPVKFIVDVYKTIGTVQDDIQITYAEELDDITKKESRAAFVTALQGVGGAIQPPEGTIVDTTIPEKHVDFADLEYKDDNFISPKGDKFLRATKANAYFNPGNNGYIESYYDYDTQSASELLNRTLSQLKIYSEPQYTYEASVKVIDPRLEIGDTVTIIDHEYNPALYLRARVSTLEKSYTDPSKGAVTFTNYELIDGSVAGKLQELQTIVNSLPGNATIQVINNNINLLNQTQQKLLVRLDSADGKNSLYYGYKPKTAKNGDVAFVKNADGVTEIWAFVEGVWALDTGIATFDDVKKAASAAADAGSQAVIAGQQASAAGADAKSAGDFAASAASQSTIETAAAQSAANSAVDQAKSAISQAGFANNAADQAKSAAASAQSDAADALGQASTAIANASTAINAATDAQTKTNSLVTKVDDIAGTIQTLATTQSVDKLAGTVTTVQNLAQFASDGLKLKADSSTVSSLDGRVTKLSGQLDVQADKIAATVTASDVTGMLNGYATQTWAQNQINISADGINGTISSVKSTVDSHTTSINTLQADSSGFKAQFQTVNDTLSKHTTDIGSLQTTSKELSSNFSSLSTDNNTNKNNISQLKQTATEFTSSLETVQTQVQDSAVGTNLAFGTNQEYVMGFGIPNTVWKDGYAYLGLPLNTTAGEILPQEPHDFWYTMTQGVTYTQTIWFETDATVKDLSTTQITWFSYAGHDVQPAGVQKLGQNSYKIVSTYTWPSKSYNSVRLFDIENLSSAFDLSTGTYLKFGKLKLEKGSLSTDWSPAPEDMATVVDVSSRITQLQSDINLRVKTGDLINQINISTEGILIDGSKTHITNTTTIDTGVIKTASIADAAITTAKISELAVNTAQIADAAINSAKIASLAVGTAQIADGAISTAKIGTAAITSAQIADASILDAKIVNLDGSKIVAHSITADKLDVNAIAVGLNTYGTGWQITPASIAFLPNAGSTKASLVIDGTGITFGDIGNGETLAMLQGTPYNTTKDTWYNGMLLDLSPNNDYVAMVDESGSAAKTKVAWSRADKTDFGMYSGFNFYDHVHFNTIGPFDPDSKARLKLVRVQIAGRWCTGFMNSNNNQPNASGIVFTDDGATYLGRAGMWYNLFDIVNKIGIA